MLAKNVQTLRALRLPASSLTSIASMLAPTGEMVVFVRNRTVR